MTLARHLGVLSPRFAIAPESGMPFVGGRGFVPISCAFKKDDNLSFSARATGAGPAPAWYPQVRDGLGVVEAEVYPGAALYDSMTDSTWTELGDRLARMVTPRTWRGCTAGEAPSGSWTLATNGCPATTLDPIGQASSQGSNFWDPPWALWSVDGEAGYRTNQATTEMDAQSHYGPLIRGASRLMDGTLIAGSSIYSESVSLNIPCSAHAAVWLATEPGAPERLRFAWSPFWPACMANWESQRSNSGAAFEGAPDGSTIGNLSWRAWGRHWQWKLDDANGMLGALGSEYPTAPGDWDFSYWVPDTGHPDYPDGPAAHDPPGQAMVWGVPYDGNIYLCDFSSGDATSVSFGGEENDIVIEWAPLTWQEIAGDWVLVAGAWTAFHTGALGSVWATNALGIRYVAMATQPTAGQVVAIRARYISSHYAFDIVNYRGIGGWMCIPMQPAPAPWLLPTGGQSPAVVVGYRP